MGDKSQPRYYRAVLYIHISHGEEQLYASEQPLTFHRYILVALFAEVLQQHVLPVAPVRD